MTINFAITLNPDAPPETLIRIVQLAESLGFSHCYLGDEGFTRDVYVTLAMLAQATRRIRLGPGITNPYTRHPAATAVAIASLDELSGGRAFLGVGAGGSLALGPMQLSRTSPLIACREMAEIARQLWQGQAVTYQGKLFQLAEAHLDFPARPDIELHWAARGPKMLALGSELADVIMLHGIPRFELADVVAQVRHNARRAGRTVRVQYAVPLVYDEASREGIRARTAFRVVDSTDRVRQKLGVSPELRQALRHLVTTKGPQAAAHLISDEILSHYILEGDVESCASSLRELVEQHSIDGITIDVSDLNTADTFLRYTAEVIASI